MGRKKRQQEKWVTEDPVGRRLQLSRRTMVTISQKLERMEQIHTSFVKTQAASGCTSVFSDASGNLPDRSKVVLHVQVSM